MLAYLITWLVCSTIFQCSLTFLRWNLNRFRRVFFFDPWWFPSHCPNTTLVVHWVDCKLRPCFLVLSNLFVQQSLLRQRQIQNYVNSLRDFVLHWNGQKCQASDYKCVCVSVSPILSISTKIEFINFCYLHCWWIWTQYSWRHTFIKFTIKTINPIQWNWKQNNTFSQSMHRYRHATSIQSYIFIILRQIELYINNGFVFEPCKHKNSHRFVRNRSNQLSYREKKTID